MRWWMGDDQKDDQKNLSHDLPSYSEDGDGGDGRLLDVEQLLKDLFHVRERERRW